LSARPRKGVELRLAAFRRCSPLAFDESGCFEPVKRGIERALIDREHIVGHSPNTFGDSPAVQRRDFKRPQYEEVEYSLEKFRLFALAGFSWHAQIFDNMLSNVKVSLIQPEHESCSG